LLFQIQQHKTALIFIKMHLYAQQTGKSSIITDNPERFIKFFFLQTADKITERARIAKTLGLTEQECLHLALHSFAPNLSDLKEFLKTCPHLEVGYSSKCSLKLKHLLLFPSYKGQLVQKTSIEYAVLDFYNTTGTRDTLFGATQELLQGYRGLAEAEAVKLLPKVIKTIEIPENPSEEQLLSQSAIVMRQAEIFSQAVFRPETSMVLGFSGVTLPLPRMIKYVMEKREQAEKELGEEATQEQLKERIVELQLVDMFSRMNKMGRLQLTVEEAPFDPNPCIIIRGRGKDEDDRRGFFFYPKGISAVVQEIPAISPRPDPFAHTSGYIGLIGRTLLVSKPEKERPAGAYERLTPAQAFQETQKLDSDLDAALRYSLAALHFEPGFSQFIAIFDAMIENTYLLDLGIGQRRFTEVIFDREIIDRFIQSNQYERFSVQLEKISALILTSMHEKNYKRAAFLLHLCHSIKKRILTIQKPPSQAISDLAKKIPTLSTEAAVSEPLISWQTLFEESKDTTHARAVSAYLLDYLDEEQINKATPEMLAQILRAWENFSSPGGEDFSQHLAELIKRKMQNSLIPAILNRLKDDPTKNPVLSSWTGFSGTWTANPEKPYIFTSGLKVIDVSRGDAKREFSRTATTKLPESIFKHPCYQKIFGNSRPTVEIAVENSRTICTWVEENRKFRLLFDPSISKPENQLTISFEEGSSLYTFCETKMSGTAGLSSQVQRHGIWRDSKGQTLVLMKALLDYKGNIASNPLTLKLTIEKGVIEKAITGDNKKVCDDPDGALAKLFPFFPQDELFFILDQNGHNITEVRIPNLPFSLLKTADGWRASNSPSKWLCHVVADDRFMPDLGSNYRDCVLVLTNDSAKQKEYRIFPKFLRQTPIAHVRSAPPELTPNPTGGPFVLKINEKGKKSGSHAAFFSLAYLAMTERNYTKAAEWIELAKREGSVDPKDLSFLKSLVTELPNLPQTTFRAQAALLKFQIALKKTLQEQYYVPEFESLSANDFLKETDHFIKLFLQYEKGLKQGNHESAAKAENLLLTPEERSYFEYLRVASIRTALDFWPQKELEKPQEAVLFQAPAVSEGFLQHLIFCMKPINPDAIGDLTDALLEKLREEQAFRPSKTILENFFTLWSLVANDKCTPADLAMLRGPVIDSHDRELNAAVDEARKLLLSLVLLQPHTKNDLIPSQEDIDSIKKQIELRDKLPKGKATPGSIPILSQALALRKIERGETIFQTLHKRLQERLTKFTEALKQAAPPPPVVAPARRDTLSLQNARKRFAAMPDSAEKTLYLEAIDKLIAESTNPNEFEHPFTELLTDLAEAGAPPIHMQYDAAICQEIKTLEAEKPAEDSQFVSGAVDTMHWPGWSDQLLKAYTGDSIVEPSFEDLSKHLQKLGRFGRWQARRKYGQQPFPTEFSEPKSVSTTSEAIQWLQFATRHVSGYIQKEVSRGSIEEDKKRFREALENPVNLKLLYCQYISFKKEAAIKQLTAQRDAARNRFPEAGTPMKRGQNKKIHEGIEVTYRARLEDLQAEHPLVIRDSKIREMHAHLSTIIQDSHEKLDILKRDILKIANGHSSSLRLGMIGPQRTGQFEQETLEQLRDLYQDGKILGLLPGEIGTSLETKLTQYLFLSADCQQLEKALHDENGPSLWLLEQMKLQRDQARDEKSRFEIEAEWRVVSKEVLAIIKRAITPRYQEEGGKYRLQNPEKMRSFLVLEDRAGIILTPEQRERIDRIADDPHALEELRMGLGKSSVIFPMLARILSKKGKFPVVLFTEELVTQSRADMDRRAYEFKFDRNHSLDVLLLRQEYKTLLEARHSGRYIITTVDRLAALDNKIIELLKDLKSKNEEIKKTELNLFFARRAKNQEAEKKCEARLEELGKECLTIKSQLFWLQKTTSLFSDEGTQIIADEADQIYSISSEKNYSDGALRNINTTIFGAGEKIFSLILIDPDFKVLLEHLQKDSQSTLKQEAIHGFIQALAGKIAADKEYWEGFGWDLATYDEKLLTTYLIGETEERPACLPEWPKKGAPPGELRKFEAMAAMRHWFTKTIPLLMQKRAGIDYDLSGENGFSVVPRKEGREKPGVRFGEEYELAGYAMLTYLRKPMTREAFRSIYPLLKDKKKDEKWFQDLIKLCKNPDPDAEADVVYQELLKSENVSARLNVLHYLFQETSREQVFERQIRRNVQDTTRHRNVAGASGTMNPFALPHSFHPGASTQYRSTTGDLVMKLSAMWKGLEEEVTAFIDPIEQMKSICKNPDYKAIINLGSDVEGKTTTEIIKALRQTPEGRDRQFIFIDPITKKAQLWNPGAQNPVPFDKVLDAAKVDPKKCIYYFSPADTRGTDFKIPFGIAALIVGPTNDLDSFEQAAYRCRKLGQGQTLKLFVEKPFADRLGGKPTVGDVLGAIRDRTIDQEELADFKAASSEPLAILRAHIQQALSTPQGDPLRIATVSQVMQKPKDEFKEISALASAFSEIEYLFIQDKTPDFQQDYVPTKKEAAKQYMLAAYDAQIAAIDHLTSKFSKNPRFQAALAAAKKEIQAARIRIDEKWDAEFQPALPEKIAAAASIEADTQSEVQQQQQQQQQVTVAKGAVKVVPLIVSPQENLTFSMPDPAHDYLDQFSLSSVFPDCGLDDVYASNTMLDLLKVMPSQGSLPGYIGTIVQNGKPITFLLSPAAMPLFVDAAIHAETLGKPLKDPLAAFLIKKDGPPEEMWRSSDYPKPPPPPEWIEQVVKAKLVLGFSKFPPEELAILEKWLSQLDPKKKGNLIKQLEKQGCIEGVKLLQGKASSAAGPKQKQKKPLGPKPLPAPQKPAPGFPPSQAPSLLTSSLAGIEQHGLVRPVTGDGNCAATALARQLTELGQTINQNQLRKAVSEYMTKSADVLKDDELFVGYVYSSINSIPGAKPANIAEILAIKDAQQLSGTQKKTLISWYGEKVKENGFWLDIAFFIAASKCFNRPIAIMKQDPFEQYALKYQIIERYPTDDEFNIHDCAIVYFNGTSNFAGNHYEDIERNEDYLKALVEKDAALKKLEELPKKPQIKF
jgi:hypothetical protein